ncbi:hypothetical protein PCANB_000025 [Pneumocystis canis]|nr:hypothetical protein PCANB_000025 [Pneumocystis canis]
MRSSERLQRWFERHQPTSNVILNDELNIQPIQPTISNKTCLISLISSHTIQFKQWAFELNEGYSIILYGYGSKRALLNDFIAQYFTNLPVFIVHGEASQLTLKKLLINLLNTLNSNNDLNNDSIDILLQRIIHEITSTQEKLSSTISLLVIYNIDGPALRSSFAQRCLIRLANVIPLIATVDHVNASLLYDTSLTSRMLWHDATTFAPFIEELNTQNTITNALNHGRYNHSLRRAESIRFVLATLTPAAREMFKVLLEHQLEAMVNETDKKIGYAVHGLAVDQLYTRCTQAMIVSHTLGFRTLLTEFYDHQIIRSQKDVTGTEIIWVPLEKPILQKIFDKLTPNEI